MNDAGTEDLQGFDAIFAGGIKGKTFTFDNSGRARAAFWLNTKDHDDKLNLWDKVGVTFLTEPKDDSDPIECEVFHLEGKDLFIDDSYGTEMKMGSRVSGSTSFNQMIMLEAFNGPEVCKLDGVLRGSAELTGKQIAG